jgi:hypothetical protein
VLGVGLWAEEGRVAWGAADGSVVLWRALALFELEGLGTAWCEVSGLVFGGGLVAL